MEYLTTKAAAAYAQRSYFTIVKWFHAGWITGKQSGVGHRSTILIDKASLERYLRQPRRAGNPHTKTKRA